jgi:hypothetical protein
LDGLVVKGPTRALKTAIIVIAVVTIAFSGFFIFSSVFLQRINDEDVPKIVRLTLERAVVKGEIPAYEVIKNNESIVLSTENIDLALMPKVDGVNFTLLSQDQIQDKANREGDFLYLRFGEVKREDTKVTVSLDNTWAASENSTMGYLSGGGFTIEYTKDFFGTLNSKIKVIWMA